MPRLIFLLLFALPALAQQPANDPFLHRLYDQLHDSPAQRAYRKLAPMPAGVVYVQQPHEDEADMRQHFRTMKRLGFTNLKQIMPCAPNWTVERIGAVALSEGIIPWWYGEGGFAPPSDSLLTRLGIPANTPTDALLKNQTFLTYQFDLLKQRNARERAYADTARTGLFMRSTSVAYDPEVGGRGADLSPEGERLFMNWLRQTYGSVDSLNRGWNLHHAGLSLGETRLFRDWDEVTRTWRSVTGREYRHVRDIFRFKVEHNLARIRQRAAQFRAFDPHAPYRGGGELGLFLPTAWYGVDMEGIANVMTHYGSFYPSMHFSWHYDQVNHELTRPMYMQAALMNDLFKGGWTGGWESTGGPQQLDGERGATINSYSVRAGELTQLFLSQLAAGFKGFGIWCWNSRSAGKEAGEYALLDRNGQVTDRAIRMGQIGQAMQRHRFELWDAHKEPVVGVLFDWENEAVWGAMAIPGRDNFKQMPVQARVGISRTLINANVPFEYVTPTDLRKGLAGRYKVIYLPAVVALQTDLLPLLTNYVRAGGRLVLDLPSALFDERTQKLPTGKGSAFANLFGATLNDLQYAGTNRPQRLHNQPLSGFMADLTPGSAQVLTRYDNNQPAVLENRLGAGSALLLGYEASLGVFAPGKPPAEAQLLRYILGPNTAPFACTGAIAYRLASPKADHYFLLNDGPARTAKLETRTLRYRAFSDAVTGEKLTPTAIPVEGYGGRWVRAGK
jgi:beta-galactosidase